MDISQYAKERDKAFIDFVETGSLKKVNALCKKYGVPQPRSIKGKKAGIYKAVQYCTNIPEEVKGKAAKKCLELGFSPLIAPIEKKGGK